MIPWLRNTELVSSLATETLKSGWKYYNELDLNLTDAGRKILRIGLGKPAPVLSWRWSHMRLILTVWPRK